MVSKESSSYDLVRSLKFLLPSKMARGAMVRYLAENQIENIKDITQFSDLGYTFDASQSTEKNYIFKKKLSSW